MNLTSFFAFSLQGLALVDTWVLTAMVFDSIAAELSADGSACFWALRKAGSDDQSQLWRSPGLILRGR